MCTPRTFVERGRGSRPPPRSREAKAVESRRAEMISTRASAGRLKYAGPQDGEAVWEGRRARSPNPAWSAASSAVSAYSVHPALLDCALQTLISAAGSAFQRGGPGLPVSLERVDWYGRAGDPAWAQAKVLRLDGSSLEGDVDVLHDDGRIALRVRALRAVRPGGPGPGLAALPLYTMRWHARPRATLDRHLAALPAPAAIVAQLARSAADLPNEFDWSAAIARDVNTVTAIFARRALERLGGTVEAAQRLSVVQLAAQLGVAQLHHRLFARLIEIAMSRWPRNA